MNNITSLRIDVPTPCTQSWNQMTPSADGRFCQHCTKNVIDFSGMSDQEVVRIISQSNGGLCGHYREDQLNRELVTERLPDHSLAPALLLSAAMTVGIGSVEGRDTKIKLPVANIQVDTTLTPPCQPVDTTEDLLAGYPAMSKDFEVIAYGRTRTVSGYTMTIHEIRGLELTPKIPKQKRKWFSFLRKRR